ncbi:MAG: GntR family transcriptional regulator, partial [Pseudomonadota bacterium]|nr:GntR family transcriptional regulator [Pseudomonadota bacterium]
MTELDTGGPMTGTRKPRAANTAPDVSRLLRVRHAEKSSDIVYRELRHAIVTMAMVPGTPIVERELTTQYGVSRTPVREAVLRLVEDRLVDVAPKSGTFVARIPLAVLREALVARCALEEVTVRAATEFASESRIMEMRAIIQRQQEMADSGNEEAFHLADED